jgi:hypothetical protein
LRETSHALQGSIVSERSHVIDPPLALLVEVRLTLAARRPEVGYTREGSGRTALATDELPQDAGIKCRAAFGGSRDGGHEVG